MSKLFIGLDISITSTGYSMVSDDRTIDRTGTVTVPKSLSKELNRDTGKFQFLASSLLTDLGVYEGLFFSHIPYILIENYAYSSKGQVLRIAEFTGVVKSWLFQSVSGSNIAVCAPATLKKFVLGKAGKGAKKAQMMLEVYKKWGFSPPNDDVSDAYALMRLGELVWLKVNDPEKMDAVTKYQAECVEAVLKQNPEGTFQAVAKK